MPNGIPAETVSEMLATFRETARAAGRDADELAVNAVAYIHLTPAAMDGDREAFTGSAEQIRADIAQFRDLRANEIIFELDSSPPTPAILDTMGHLRDLVR